MTLLSPSDIYFSQDSISNRFGNYTPHYNTPIGNTLDDILHGKCSINDFPTISVIKKGPFWVTADNRRLWIFKKLQALGKCEKIEVKVEYHINPKKCCILSSTRVRGDPGGYLWRYSKSERSIGAKTMNQTQDTSTSIRTVKKEVSSYRYSVNDHDEPKVQDSARSSVENPLGSYHSYTSFNESKRFLDRKSFQAWEPAKESQHEDTSLSGYQSYESNRYLRTATNELPKHLRFPREPHYLGNSSIESPAIGSAEYRKGSPKFPTSKVNHDKMDDSNSTKNSSTEQTRQTFLDRGARPKDISTGTGYPHGTNPDPRFVESKSARSAGSASVRGKVPGKSLASHITTVRLKPLDIGFAIEITAKASFNGELLGEIMDKWCPRFKRISIYGFEYSLNVFKLQGQYYSEETSKLWILQAIERYTNNVDISGSVRQTPANIFLYRLRDSLISVERLSGERWRSLDTLKMLTTKRKRTLSLSDIFYTQNAIQDTLNGRSIIKALVEIFSGEIRDHELNVMEYGGKYYTLENEKLWILKHAEKVLGNLNIIGNVKIYMDFILFHSFTTKDIRNVDIKSTRGVHTDEQRFMLKYIQRQDEEPR